MESSNDVKHIAKLFYDLDLQHYENITSGNTQMVYLLHTHKKIYILKRYLNRSYESIRFEIDVLKYLNTFELAVSKPLRNKNEEFITNSNREYFIIFEYVEGNFIDYSNTIQVDNLIQLVATIHNVSTDFTSKYRSHRLNYDISNWYNMANSFVDENSTSKYDILVNEIKEINISPEVPEGIVHCDFTSSNIIVKQNKINALIDFDDCNYSYFMMDLAQLINVFIEEYNWDTWQNFNHYNVFDFSTAQKLIKEYEKTRPLSNLEKTSFFDIYKLLILFDALWYFDRGEGSDCYEIDKLRKLRKLGKEKFLNGVFGDQVNW